MDCRGVAATTPSVEHNNLRGVIYVRDKMYHKFKCIDEIAVG